MSWKTLLLLDFERYDNVYVIWFNEQVLEFWKQLDLCNLVLQLTPLCGTKDFERLLHDPWKEYEVHNGKHNQSYILFRCEKTIPVRDI